MSAGRTYTPQEIETLIERARNDGWREGVAEGEQRAVEGICKWLRAREAWRRKEFDRYNRSSDLIVANTLRVETDDIERGEWR